MIKSLVERLMGSTLGERPGQHHLNTQIHFEALYMEEFNTPHDSHVLKY
jgi:hypothetical protein